jgi:hypothetical protein
MTIASPRVVSQLLLIASLVVTFALTTKNRTWRLVFVAGALLAAGLVLIELRQSSM